MLSLATAAGIDPTDLQYAESINRALGYIEYAYIPVIYKSHTIESQGYVTINPVENGIVDRLLDMNYFKTLTKIDRKARIILGRCKILHLNINKLHFYKKLLLIL